MTAREPGPRPPDVVLTANQAWIIRQAVSSNGGLTRYLRWEPHGIEVEEFLDLFRVGLLQYPADAYGFYRLTDDGLVVYARLSRNQPRGTSDGLG